MSRSKSEAWWRNCGVKDAIQTGEPRVDEEGFYLLQPSLNEFLTERIGTLRQAAYWEGFTQGKKATAVTVDMAGTTLSIFFLSELANTYRVLTGDALEFLGKAVCHPDGGYYKLFRPGGTPVEGHFTGLHDAAKGIIQAREEAVRQKAEHERLMHEQFLLNSISVRNHTKHQGFVSVCAEGDMLQGILQDALNGNPPTEASRKQIETFLQRFAQCVTKDIV